MMEYKLIKYLIVALLVSFVGCGNTVLAKTLKEQRIDINVQNIPNYLLITFLAKYYKVNVVIGDEFIKSRISVNESSILPEELIKRIVNQQGLNTKIDNGIMKIASKCRLEQSVDFSGILAQDDRASFNYDKVKAKQVVDIIAGFVETSITLNDANSNNDVSYVTRNKPAGELLKALSIVQGWRVEERFFGGYRISKNPMLNECYLRKSKATLDDVSNIKFTVREFSCPNGMKEKCDFLERYDLKELLFLGYVKDSDSTKFSAIIETIDGHAHRLKAGRYIGKNFGEVRKIDNKGNIFIREKVFDNVDGWLDRNIIIKLGERYESPREKLLKKFSPPIRNTTIQARFIQAAGHGDLGKLKYIIKSDEVDVDAVSKKNGLNALTLAIYNGHDDIVKWLIRRDARVNILVTNREKSPLIIAATAGMADTVKLLLSAGAIVDLVDYKELTPLYMATVNNDIPVIRLLVNKGADILKYNRYGLTPSTRAANNGYVEIINLFLKKGIDINAKDRNGHTMLMAATYGNKIELVKVLILKGANINLSRKQKETALDIAVTKKYKELAIYLKSKGAVSFNKKH